MQRDLKFAPRAAIFLAGAAAAALTGIRRYRSGWYSAPVRELKRSLAGLEARLASQDSTNAARFSQIEARLEEHSARLAEVPSTDRIVSAMEQLLSKTMTSLDERLTIQAHSIEVLKTAVSQTDGLLERVLESLDSLQAEHGSQEADVAPHRPAM